MERKDYIGCPWRPFKEEIMMQWRKLDESDLQEAGRNRRLLARIIERKYGIAWQLVESYLTNLEKSLARYHPMAA